MRRAIPGPPEIWNSDVYFTNFARLRVIGGIKTPRANDSLDEAAKYHEQISLLGLVSTGLISSFAGYAEPFQKSNEALVSSFGYSFANVDIDMDIGSKPFSFSMIRGRFNRAKMESAFKTQAGAAPHG